MKVLIAIIQRELLLAMRSFSQILNPLLFFLMTIVLFPLGISPETTTLQTIGPGVIWIAALLATLLTLDNLFRSDYEDGALDQLLLNQESLSLVVMAKVFAHWCVTGLPLILISPLMGAMLFLPAETIWLLMLTLLIGTPILSLIGSIHMALTINLGRGNMLLSILTVPFYVPVLIFATMIIELSRGGMDYSGQLQLLVAMLVLSLVLAPLATAMALRISAE